ncbi:hypothetical protein DFJ73DRAFT_142482 [Zopfochytrium polystomum]|nr:hypothetical protein DFJ73DRAFT_142482 [Zopfochytrium polystomum]
MWCVGRPPWRPSSSGCVLLRTATASSTSSSPPAPPPPPPHVNTAANDGAVDPAVLLAQLAALRAQVAALQTERAAIEQELAASADTVSQTLYAVSDTGSSASSTFLGTPLGQNANVNSVTDGTVRLTSSGAGCGLCEALSCPGEGLLSFAVD